MNVTQPNVKKKRKKKDLRQGILLGGDRTTDYCVIFISKSYESNVRRATCVGVLPVNVMTS